MTLSAFPPESLDALALRVLDLAGVLRAMAKEARDHDLQGFQLNSKKAHEWLDQLEHWGAAAKGELQLELIREQGRRRAEAEKPRGKKKAKRSGY